MNAFDSANAGTYYKTDDRHSQISIWFSLHADTAVTLCSSVVGTFCGRNVSDSARLRSKRFRSRKSKVEARTKKMEVGRGGKEKGFLSLLSPFPSPLVYASVIIARHKRSLCGGGKWRPIDVLPRFFRP